MAKLEKAKDSSEEEDEEEDEESKQHGTNITRLGMRLLLLFDSVVPRPWLSARQDD